MHRYFLIKLNRNELHRSKTDFVVLARCTNAGAFVHKTSKGSKSKASELGFLSHYEKQFTVALSTID